MKERVISGLVILGIFIALLAFMATPVTPIFVALISAAAVYELNKTAGVKKQLAVPSIIMAALIPIGIYLNFTSPFGSPIFTGCYGFLRIPVLILYIISMLCLMVKWHSEVKFEQLAISVFSSLAVPYSLSCWVKFAFENTSATAYYLILLSISCSWLSDVFAYFSGRFFGKHKMAPVVSPKKTWEGAIGGVLLTAGVNVAFHFIYGTYFAKGDFAPWEWYMLIPISIILSVVSIMGDLSASVIKRQAGVKDYSNLIPGHGGIMDRFDSVLFVFPMMYVFILIFDMIG